MVREIKRPGRIRTEFTFQGLTGVYAWDGERGSQISPLDGEMESPGRSPASERLAQEQAGFGGPLLGWKEKGRAACNGNLRCCYFPGTGSRSILLLQATMASCLQLVSAQFPHVRDRVASLFEDDPVFRELCEDYEACTNALARQQASAPLRQEYAALQLRLETEMLGFLSEDADTPGRRK